MAGVINNEVMSPAVALYYAEKTISAPTANLIHGICADKFTMPAHTGDIFRKRQFNDIPVDLVPLGDKGEEQAPGEWGAINIDVRIQYFGKHLLLNQQMLLQNQKGVLAQATISLGRWLRKTEDMLTRDMLIATHSVIDCTEGVNGDNPTEPTFEDIGLVVRTLRGNDAQPLVEGMEASKNFGSAPVADAYFAMGHTDLSLDLERIPTFQPKVSYSQFYRALPSELGCVGGARILLSSIGAKLPHSSNKDKDVLPLLFTGREGYCQLLQDKALANFVYRPPRYNDALGQNSTVAITTSFGTRIMQDTAVIKLRCTKRK